MEAEQRTKRTELLRVNALTFALMVRELLLHQTEHAMCAERELLERQESECAEIVKALVEGYALSYFPLFSFSSCFSIYL